MQLLFKFDLHAPLTRPLQPLPDAMRGEQWAFVQLPLNTLLGMMKEVQEVRNAPVW